jgi:hypothetical protein
VSVSSLLCSVSLKCNICHLNNVRETWYEPGGASSVLHTKSMYINAFHSKFCYILSLCRVMIVVVIERPPGGSEDLRFDPLCSLDVSREEPPVTPVADRVRMCRYRDLGPSFNSLVWRLTK